MEELSPLLQRAKDLCIKAHEGQTRDEGGPYSDHPIAVAQILRDHGLDDEAALAAAYLHDVLEDTDVPEIAIRTDFGEEVCSIVLQLTNKGFPGRTFEQKHEALAAEAKKMEPRAKAVKLADRYHNLSKMSVWDEQRRRRYAQATFGLLEALKPWPIPELAKKIEAILADYKSQ